MNTTLIILLGAAACACAGKSGPPASAPSATTPAPPASGLQVQDGNLTRDGRPYRGIGVNYFDAFIRTVANPADASSKTGLRVLRERFEIPFIRCAAGPFWPRDWKLYREDRPRYFALMDDFVREAERCGIGLIPSLFWYYGAVPDIVGEPMDQWGNPRSETHRFMRTYVREVVGRYKDSAAVWGWEFGNEYMLGVDLPGAMQGVPPHGRHLGAPTTRTVRDKPQRSHVETAYREFARAVREIDPHRLLITGDAIPRSCAYHLHKSGAWRPDTREQWIGMLLRDNPDPFDGVSVHVYPGYDREYFPQKVPLRELLRVCRDAADGAGKPLVLGEFGASRELGEAKARECFEEFLRAIVDLKIPLSALWVYDFPHQDSTHSITADNDLAWMLQAVKDANRQMTGARPVP